MTWSLIYNVTLQSVFLKMIQRIYIDTSVVGGYFDNEFSIDTIAFFERVIKGELKLIVSDLLEA